MLKEGGKELLRHAGAAAIFMIVAAFSVSGQKTDVSAILTKVTDKIGSINTISYNIAYSERVYETDKVRNGNSSVKIQRSPRRVYMKTENGTELLWGPDLNNNEVLVHPTSFPYFTLSLDPDGYWMRRNQHHGIEDLGFDYFAALLKATIKNAGNNLSKRFIYAGELFYGGDTCIEIDIVTSDFRFQQYSVKEGETIISISRANYLNEYMVLKHNPDISSYTDVKVGQSIVIPNNYAPRVIIYINKKMMLPVMLRVDDDKGVFEKYEYGGIKINPTFNSNELTRDYKDYHF